MSKRQAWLATQSPLKIWNNIRLLLIDGKSHQDIHIVRWSLCRSVCVTTSPAFGHFCVRVFIMHEYSSSGQAIFYKSKRQGWPDELHLYCKLPLPMPAFYRSLLELTPKACTNTGQSQRPAPIRTPHSSCANQDAWAVVTPERPKTNSDTSARHVYTRTLHATLRPRLYFSNILFRLHYCVFGQRAILSLGSTTSHFTFLFELEP